MTNSPGGPDWYPDPTGKPGLMYWDGRQWHADVPAATPPAEGPPVPPAPAAARPRRHTGLVAALFAAAVVLFGIIGITGYLLLRQSHRPQTPAAPPAPAASAPQPAPTSSATPTTLNFTIPSGKICQVTAQRVTCQTCVPGHVITNLYTCTDPAPALAVDTQGILDENPPDMASPPGPRELTSGQTYHVSGWTIVVSGGWTRFINDTTGHGLAIAAQNFDSF